MENEKNQELSHHALPEMYAALKELVAWGETILEHGIISKQSGFADWVYKGKEAIKKAEGR